MGIDSDDNSHVSLRRKNPDEENNVTRLSYAKRTAGAWNVTTIDSDTNAGGGIQDLLLIPATILILFTATMEMALIPHVVHTHTWDDDSEYGGAAENLKYSVRE